MKTTLITEKFSPVLQRLALRESSSAVRQRFNNRLNQADCLRNFYEEGPSVYKPLWIEVPATGRKKRNAIAATGVAIEQESKTGVAGTVSRQDVLRLLDKGLIRRRDLATRLHDPAEILGVHIFPPEDSAYHDYQEMVASLQEAVQKRPDIARMFSIGKSLEGRDIWAVQINKDFDSSKPGAVFVGTHHAREHLATEIPLMLVQHLLSNADDPKIAKLIAERDITIIPMLNPDGVEYDIASGRAYRSWRKNRRPNANGTRGVDLNRNYGFGWGGEGSSGNPSSETYRGPSPFSEPETQNFRDFVISKPNTRVLLTFHTFSELILYPFGHTYDDIPDKKHLRIFEAMAKKMAKWNGYTPQKSSALYLADGEACDWLYGERGIFAFTFELTPRDISDGGFYPGSKVIQPTFDKNLPAVLYMIDLADSPERAIIPLP